MTTKHCKKNYKKTHNNDEELQTNYRHTQNDVAKQHC